MRVRNMHNFWNKKIIRFFKQSTALVVVGALLISIILPPFASASLADRQAKQTSSKAENFKLREHLLFDNKPKSAQAEVWKELLNKYNPQKSNQQSVDQKVEFPRNILNIAKQEFLQIREQIIALFETVLRHVVDRFHKDFPWLLKARFISQEVTVAGLTIFLITAAVPVSLHGDLLLYIISGGGLLIAYRMLNRRSAHKIGIGLTVVMLSGGASIIIVFLLATVVVSALLSIINKESKKTSLMERTLRIYVDGMVNHLLNSKAPEFMASNYVAGFIKIGDVDETIDYGDSMSGKIEQALTHLGIATNDPLVTKRVRAALNFLAKHPRAKDLSVMQFEGIAHGLVKRFSGNDHAFKPYKERLDEAVQKLYEPMRQEVLKLVQKPQRIGLTEERAEALRTAMISAGIMNLFDHTRMQPLEEFANSLGIVFDWTDPNSFNRLEPVIKKMVLKTKVQGPIVDEFEQFVSLLRKNPGGGIVYFLDNHGEAIFDQIAIEQLLLAGYRVTVVARGEVVRDDVTVEEAKQIIENNPIFSPYLENKSLLVTTNGSFLLGADLSQSSQHPEFLEAWGNAVAYVAKGAGNFHTLYTQNLSIPGFHILMSKKIGTVIAKINEVKNSSIPLDTNRLAFVFQDTRESFLTRRKTWDAPDSERNVKRPHSPGNPSPQLRTIEDLTEGRSTFLKINWDIGEDPGDGDTKIVQTVETVQLALKKFDELFICTHLGRPTKEQLADPAAKDKFDVKKKVLPLAKKRMTEIGIEAETVMLPEDINAMSAAIESARKFYPNKKIVFMLPNSRFYPEESSHYSGLQPTGEIQDEFIERILNALGRPLAYINEAIESHDTDATVRMANHFPPEARAAGISFVNEVNKKLKFEAESHGAGLVIWGGTKPDKIYKHLLKYVSSGKQHAGDVMAIIGALAYPFLKSRGVSIGKSLLPKREAGLKVEKALPQIFERAKENGINLLLPTDHRVIEKDKDTARLVNEIGEQEMAIDIGSETLDILLKEIDSVMERHRRTGEGWIIANGGAGVFERDDGRLGTRQLLEKLEEARETGVPVLLVGGDMQKAVNEVREKDWDGRDLNPAIQRTTAGGTILATLANGISNHPPVQALLKNTNKDIAHKGISTHSLGIFIFLLTHFLTVTSGLAAPPGWAVTALRPVPSAMSSVQATTSFDIAQGGQEELVLPGGYKSVFVQRSSYNQRVGVEYYLNKKDRVSGKVLSKRLNDVSGNHFSKGDILMQLLSSDGQRIAVFYQYEDRSGKQSYSYHYFSIYDLEGNSVYHFGTTDFQGGLQGIKISSIQLGKETLTIKYQQRQAIKRDILSSEKKIKPIAAPSPLSRQRNRTQIEETPDVKVLESPFIVAHLSPEKEIRIPYQSNSEGITFFILMMDGSRFIISPIPSASIPITIKTPQEQDEFYYKDFTPDLKIILFSSALYMSFYTGLVLESILRRGKAPSFTEFLFILFFPPAVIGAAGVLNFIAAPVPEIESPAVQSDHEQTGSPINPVNQATSSATPAPKSETASVSAPAPSPESINLLKNESGQAQSEVALIAGVLAVIAIIFHKPLVNIITAVLRSDPLLMTVVLGLGAVVSVGIIRWLYMNYFQSDTSLEKKESIHALIESLSAQEQEHFMNRLHYAFIVRAAIDRYSSELALREEEKSDKYWELLRGVTELAVKARRAGVAGVTGQETRGFFEKMLLDTDPERFGYAAWVALYALEGEGGLEEFNLNDLRSTVEKYIFNEESDPYFKRSFVLSLRRRVQEISSEEIERWLDECARQGVSETFFEAKERGVIPEREFELWDWVKRSSPQEVKDRILSNLPMELPNFDGNYNQAYMLMSHALETDKEIGVQGYQELFDGFYRSIGRKVSEGSEQTVEFRSVVAIVYIALDRYSSIVTDETVTRLFDHRLKLAEEPIAIYGEYSVMYLPSDTHKDPGLMDAVQMLSIEKGVINDPLVIRKWIRELTRMGKFGDINLFVPAANKQQRQLSNTKEVEAALQKVLRVFPHEKVGLVIELINQGSTFLEVIELLKKKMNNNLSDFSAADTNRDTVGKNNSAWGIAESEITQMTENLIEAATRIRRERRQNLNLMQHMRDWITVVILKVYPYKIGITKTISKMVPRKTFVRLSKPHGDRPTLLEKIVQFKWTPKIVVQFMRKALSFMTAQYVAGATIQDALKVMKNMADEKEPVLSIADILGEGIKSSGEVEANTLACVALLEQMAASGLEPNISSKVTNLTLSSLLDNESTREEGIKLAVANYKKILTKARELGRPGTMVWVDKEEYRYRDIANEVVKRTLQELEEKGIPMPRGKDGKRIPDMGVVVQTYFIDSLAEVEGLLEWMEKDTNDPLPIAIRLVKGAYHEKEIKLAKEKPVPVPIPVWQGHWKTDENYLEILRLLMKKHTVVQRIGIASHDVRTIVSALLWAKELKVDPSTLEFQTLFGMTENLKRALHEIFSSYWSKEEGIPRVYAYVPFIYKGNIETGIKYLLRRFEENSTANAADENVKRAETGKMSAAELAKPKWGPKFLAKTKGESIEESILNEAKKLFKGREDEALEARNIVPAWDRFEVIRTEHGNYLFDKKGLIEWLNKTENVNLKISMALTLGRMNYQEDVRRNFGDTLEPELGSGGNWVWFKDLFFPHLTQEEYSLKWAWLEDLISYGGVSLLIGLPVYFLSPSNLQLSLQISYFIGLLVFINGHKEWIANLRHSRAPPQYLQSANKIARINLLLAVIQLVLPIPFWISFPMLMVFSSLTHYFENKNTIDSASQDSSVDEAIQAVRKYVETEPEPVPELEPEPLLLYQLAYHLTKVALSLNNALGKKLLIVVQLDKFVRIKGEDIHVPKALQIVLKGMTDAMKEAEENKAKVAFVFTSPRHEDAIHTILDRMSIPKKLVLFSAQTSDEAQKEIEKKNLSVSFVLTLFPKQWEGYAKVTLSKLIWGLINGYTMKVDGEFARRLEAMIQELGLMIDRQILRKDGQLILKEQNFNLNPADDLWKEEIYKMQA